MPYIHIKTNVSMDEQTQVLLKTQLGQAITALPGKSEAWLMVELTAEAAIWFQGTDEPAAMADVALYGSAQDDAYDSLTARICDIVNNALEIPQDRIYTKYTETPVWGWNGSNF